MISAPWSAYLEATGEEMPADAFTPRYPELTLDVDFEDEPEMQRRLPRLTTVCYNQRAG